MHWLGVFFYLYALGTSAGLAAVPFRDLGRRFFRVNTWIILAFAIVATAVARPGIGGGSEGLKLFGDVAAWLFVLGAMLVAFIVRATRRDVKQEVFYLPVSIGALFVAALAAAMHPGRLGDAALTLLHLLTSAAVLGLSLVSMILGHWYLQNAALSFDLLKKMAWLFVAACLAKAAISGVYLAPEAARWRPLLLTEFDGMLVLVRVGAGWIGATALGFMALSCARAKANQSATGILYVAVVFALVGELISIYLTLARNMPL
ncbi:MAG: hypothetical protein HY716_08130 [Planctomycetes bacterium]|nr:hypothetical protein [Planctomycetota bacterium]